MAIIAEGTIHESNGPAAEDLDFDAVLILGGGLAHGGRLPAFVLSRLDCASEYSARYYIALRAGPATSHHRWGTTASRSMSR